MSELQEKITKIKGIENAYYMNIATPDKFHMKTFGEFILGNLFEREEKEELKIISKRLSQAYRKLHLNLSSHNLNLIKKSHNNIINIYSELAIFAIYSKTISLDKKDLTLPIWRELENLETRSLD